MSNLMIFNNQEFGQIRVLDQNGESLFVGKDVAEILGYKDTSDALKRHVDSEDKLTRCFTDSGQSRKMIVINESGLYSLILSSKLPNSKKFKRWVTSEVLPQIRKTGGYIPIEESLSDAEIMARALMVAQNTLKKKDEILKAKEIELSEKNKFINQIAISKNSLKVAEVAQIASKNGIKIGQNRLWAKLREWGLIKESSKYDPKQRYIDCGYFEIVEGAKETYKGVFTYKTTKVTGKGQVYIIDKLLKEVG
ncbi:BRO family protein [Clostridium perfringens]|uniref:phage antirepressor KilAC domain-containing protein n=1 Tax=Clostridium perfringens TaxID=1502 RepID=UPI0018E48602|nr:phage antirepressor KilAC domain-containing protein [Clostridium perfringens]MBI5993947.1 phage antirepressor KilAC domain-containing protein [Clostridium perfringens]MDK0630055.1 BRO family protein [Clostridium perfringens]MDM0450001.1 BRO family protein [Clostridium perfringens]HAT4312040.1 phage antirepressor Ant [Clostridium perfringens]